MSADIEKGAEVPISCTHHNDAFRPYGDHLIGAWRGERIGPPNADPHAAKDALHFSCVEGEVIIVAARKRGNEREFRMRSCGHGLHLLRTDVETGREMIMDSVPQLARIPFSEPMRNVASGPLTKPGQ